jgi:PIN domain nuclease of toxin-antitoxin system
LRLLLDAHIWISSVLDESRLTKRVHEELADPANELWLSSASIWEAFPLHSKGRVWLSDEPIEWSKAAAPFAREAPLTHEIAAHASGLRWDHRDPVDRFIAATASVLGLTLVTADEKLPGFGAISTLANR